MARKTALITGSTSGIGLGIAKVLAEKGVNIVINGFGEASEIQEIIKNLQNQHKIKVKYDPANMTKSSEIHKMVEETAEEFGSLDILVNNAGIQHVEKIEDFPAQKWDDIIAINLSSSFHTISKAIPHMKKSGWGRIVNIASTHGLVASANKSAYVAAKHGIIGLTKVVALENARNNITCNAICPGWVLTPLVEKQIIAKAEAKNQTFEQAKIELLSEKQPTLEFATPEQIGEAVAFLTLGKSESITGTSIAIDGGWTAQ